MCRRRGWKRSSLDPTGPRHRSPKGAVLLHRSLRSFRLQLFCCALALRASSALAEVNFPARFLAAEAGVGPFDVAITDLDQDGRPDLIVTNSASNTISVLLGNGDGTFQPHSDFTTGRRPGSLAIGDLNLDGWTDVVTSNEKASTVSVLLGHGDGTFGPKADLGTRRDLRCVRLGDLNGDGKLDLATSNSAHDSIEIRFRNGDGTFSSSMTIRGGLTPRAVTIAIFYRAA